MSSRAVKRRIRRVSSHGEEGGSAAVIEKFQRLEYLCGTITRIRFLNFMCHERLELFPDPGVNIITGVNGSGKSSVIQGLVLGLGGVAKNTSRLSNMGSFVMSEKNKALIQVTLSNEGEKAYLPKTFGKRITFERTIYVNKEGKAGNTFSIKDENMKTVYSAKRAGIERKSILDHFYIELDNPITILQEEKAVSFFLGLSNEEMLYNFIMKSEQSSIALRNASTNIDFMKMKAEELDKMIEAKVAKWKKWKDKFEEMQKSQSQVCHYDAQDYDDAQDPKKRFLDKQQKCNKEKLQKHRLKNLLKDCKDVRSDVQKKYEDILEGMMGEKYLAAEMQARKLKEEIVSLEEKLKNMIPEMTFLEDEMKRIREERRQLENLKVVEFGKTGLSNDDLETKRKRHEKIINNINIQLNSITKDISRLGELRGSQKDKLYENEEAEKRLKEKHEKLKTKKRDIEYSLAQEKCNNWTVDRYGPKMLLLVNAIEERKSNFTIKPLGPIGRYIKLVNEASNLANLIETEIGSQFLTNFVVFNDSDRRELESIMLLVYGRDKSPVIIQTEFRTNRYPLKTSKIKEGLYWLVDLMHFEDDNIFNVVVDNMSVEKIVVGCDDDIMSLFSEESSVSRNVAKAISKSFRRYIPSTRGSFSSHYMKRTDGVLLLDSYPGEQIVRLQEVLSNIQANISEVLEEIKKVYDLKCLLNKDLSEVGQLIADKRKIIESLRIQKQEEKQRFYSMCGGHYQAVITKLENLDSEFKLIETDFNAKSKKETALKSEKDRATQRYEELLRNCSESGYLEDRGRLQDLQRQIVRLDEKLCENSVYFQKHVLALKNLEKNAKSLSNIIRKEALEFCGGEEIDVEDLNEAEVGEERNQFQLCSQQIAKTLGHSRSEIVENAQRLESEITELKCQRQTFQEKIEMDVKRKLKMKEIKGNMIRELSCNFCLAMMKLSMRGELTCKNEEPRARIRACSSKSSNLLPMAALSGGERSKTLVCLILALWALQRSPFRCLDEWDFFLDKYARKDIEQAVVNFAVSTNYQYFFISPQGYGIKSSEHVIEIKK